MGDRVGSRTGRALRAAAWTAAMAAALYAVDRTLIGRRSAEGWTEARTLEELPASVGPVATPAYLPDTLSWPPARILYRTVPQPGWWLGLATASGDRIDLWIGSAVSPTPSALGEAAGCVDLALPGGCPESWHTLSRLFRGGQTVYVLTTLDPTEATHILERLD